MDTHFVMCQKCVPARSVGFFFAIPAPISDSGAKRPTTLYTKASRKTVVNEGTLPKKTGQVFAVIYLTGAETRATFLL